MVSQIASNDASRPPIIQIGNTQETRPQPQNQTAQTSSRPMPEAATNSGNGRELVRPHAGHVEQVKTGSSEHDSDKPAESITGSPKGPIPIQFGVVREAPAPTYKFEEEEEAEDFEEEEEYELPGASPQAHRGAQLKLDELKEQRGTSAASAERLVVLQNVAGSQINEEQMRSLLQGVWGINARKKLKAVQAEALISWAKEDFFQEEVDAVLALLKESEE